MITILRAHQLRRLRSLADKPLVVNVTILLAAALVAGCHVKPAASALFTPEAPISVTTFTYSTTDGGIWQVDLAGQKTRIWEDDGLQKTLLSWSPQRSQLAYVTYEAADSVRKEILWTLDLSTRRVSSVAGPGVAIDYQWIAEELIRATMVGHPSDPATSTTEPGQQLAFEIRTDTGTRVPIELPSNQAAENKMSPNGQWHLAVESQGVSWVVALHDATGTRVSEVYRQPKNKPYISAYWSPDSRYIAYSTQDVNEVFLFDTLQHTSHQLSHLSESAAFNLVSDLQWSPNSEWLIFSLLDSSEANQLCIAHVENQSMNCRGVEWKTNLFVWSLDNRHVAFLAPVSDHSLHDIHALDVSTMADKNLTNDGQAVWEQWITP